MVRYLFIFILFAGFLLLLFVPVLNYITDFTLQNELTSVSSHMEQGISSIDSVLTSLDLIKISNNQDSRFSVFKSWIFNPPDVRQFSNISASILIELRDSFNLALLPYPLAVDSGLLLPNGMAITRNVISFYPTPVPFYGFSLQCGDLTLEEWRGLLTGGHTFIPAMSYTDVHNSTYEAVTYAAHWSYIGYPQEIVFFAIFPVEGIVNLLTDTDVAAAAIIKMYDSGGELLFSHGSANNGSYHVVRGRSTMYSLEFEISVPDTLIKTKLRQLRNQILLFTFLTAGFVITLSFLFAWRSSLLQRNFLERISPAGMVQTKYRPFSGYGRLLRELASQIEAQTALIRTQTIDRIRKALLAGDEAMSRIILRDCVAALPDPEDPLTAAQLSNLLSSLIRELAEKLPGIVVPEEIPEYVPGSQKEFFEHYYTGCFARICKSISAQKEKEIPAIGWDLLAYINKHIYDPNIYTTMVANHFNISEPTLQKYIKQCAGQTFQTYVEKRRLDRACELLLESNETIAHIALACGFSSSTSFNRTFKRIYGFPPGRLQETRSARS